MPASQFTKGTQRCRGVCMRVETNEKVQKPGLYRVAHDL